MSIETLLLAQLHNARVELEQLATKRAGMIAANIECEWKGIAPKYSEQDFEQLAEQIGRMAVDQEPLPKLKGSP